MNLLLRIGQWGDRHHPKWVDILRVVLGAFLIYKGIDFLLHFSVLTGLMPNKERFGYFVYFLAGHYVVFAHLVGGLAIMLGMFTRFACLIQIPILLGAIFFVNTNEDMLQPYSELVISVFVLIGLIYFLVAGNGPWSFKMPEEEKKQRH